MSHQCTSCRHGSLSVWATSVPAADTQVTWQNTYSSDVTSNGHLLCLHQFQFKHTACIHNVHCCGSCEGSPNAVCYATGPATVKESLCSATVVAAQPFSVLYERFHKIQQLLATVCLTIKWPIWKWSETSPHFCNRPRPTTPHTQNLIHAAVLLEKLTGSQLAKKFPAFYGTRRFLTTFTRTHHLSLPWAISIRVTIINYHRHNSLSLYDNLQCKSHQLSSQRFIRDTIHNSSPHCRDSASDNSSDAWQGNLNLWSSCFIMWLHQPTNQPTIKYNKAAYYASTPLWLQKDTDPCAHDFTYLMTSEQDCWPNTRDF
jgi:hypothetical protein